MLRLNPLRNASFVKFIFYAFCFRTVTPTVQTGAENTNQSHDAIVYVTFFFFNFLDVCLLTLTLAIKESTV